MKAQRLTQSNPVANRVTPLTPDAKSTRLDAVDDGKGDASTFSIAIEVPADSVAQMAQRRAFTELAKAVGFDLGDAALVPAPPGVLAGMEIAQALLGRRVDDLVGSAEPSTQPIVTTDYWGNQTTVQSYFPLEGSTINPVRTVVTDAKGRTESDELALARVTVRSVRPRRFDGERAFSGVINEVETDDARYRALDGSAITARRYQNPEDRRSSVFETLNTKGEVTSQRIVREQAPNNNESLNDARFGWGLRS